MSQPLSKWDITRMIFLIAFVGGFSIFMGYIWMFF